MGLVYQQNQDQIKPYPEETREISNLLIQPGQMSVQAKLAPLSVDEVKAILLKLDTMVMSTMVPAVATIVAEEIPGILTAIRMVKAETKQPFAGLLGAGGTLDIVWLRAKHIGSSILMTETADGAHGVHGQTEQTIAWLYSHTADTSTDIIPEQTMKEEAGVIHLGVMDPIEVPKLDAIQFTLAGIPTPAQPLELRLRKGFGSNEVAVVRFEKPVIVGPEKKQKISVEPYASGSDKCQLISILIAKAEDLSL